MDFLLDEEQQDLKASVEGFARRELAPEAHRRAHDAGYSWDSSRLIAKQGLLGLTIPADKGGQGGTLMDAVIAIEAVASSCPKSADVVQAGNFGAVRTFAEYASDELRNLLLPGFLSGELLLGLGMTEPEAGSAVTELTTSARGEGDEYVVNGTKIFSTHSPDATHYLVYVRFGPGLDGIGSIVIDRSAPGLTVGTPSAFMSGEEWSELHFEDCRVPASNLLLGPGGFKKQIAGFNVERIGNAARSLALGRYAFNEAREHAKLRHQFGRPLMDFQGLQWMFADMAVTLESAQLLLYKAALSAGSGLPSAYDTAVAKLACNTAGFSASNASLQVMGGMGYSQESLVEYCVRRTRGWQIAGGSTEMLKNRIAESIFETRFSQRPREGARNS